MSEPLLSPADATVEQRLLQIVEGLVAELRRGEAGTRVRLKDSLERDLGITSLERVELVLRLERAFGVRLGDAVMTAGDTPADLISAIQQAQPTTERAPGGVRPSIGAATPAPDSAATLTDVLRWHVEHHPDRVHVFLREGDADERPLTYGELWRQSLAVGGGLRAQGVGRRDTVAIMLRTEHAFFPAFFGILLAGGIPVPMYPPFRADRIQEYAERQVGILRNADVTVMITFAEVERVAKLLVEQAPALSAVVTVAHLGGGGPRSAVERGGLAPRQARGALSESKGAREQDESLPSDLPGLIGLVDSGDPCLIQYTSGSTGHPKGVLLSHGNLLANIRAIRQALRIGPEDVGVSWLPLYHDMGLIGSWLGALYFGIPMALLSPLQFLARPSRWLWALDHHRGTVSPAPNFAFDLCAQRISDDELKGLDLSCVRLLLNGSEAVAPETVERFTRRFRAYGLRPEAVCPVYGLAECSVGLTAAPVGRAPWIDRVDRRSFQETGHAKMAAATDAAPLRFVSCGHVLPDHELRLVDPSGERVSARIEGQVQFRGPSVTAGYFRNHEATREVRTPDGWMDSGDLGYLADGELFVTGRRKDIIIKGGRNLYPQGIEELAASVQGIRKGCVAAFGVPDADSGTERFIVVAETKEPNAERREEIRHALQDRIATAEGLPPDDIVLAPPGSVLKTSSGKIRRGATRDAYVSGRLERRALVAAQWTRLALAAGAARVERIGDTVLRVLFTAYCAGLLVVTLPLLWGLLRVRKRGRPADQMLRWWSKTVLRLGGCRPTVEGLQHTARVDTAVFVANHESYLDPIVVMAALPVPFKFAAKRGLTAYPIIGTAIRRADYLTIERADLSQRMEGAEDVAAVLRGGQSLFVFPEGTFGSEPGLLPFRLGAFRAAVDAGCAVVPVIIRGTRRAFPAGAWLLRPTKLSVTIGAPLVAGGTGWDAVVGLRDQARDEIQKRLGDGENW